MSALLIQVLTPVPVMAPQGALWAAQASVWLGRNLRSFGWHLWLALEAQGQRRAAQHLLALADRWEGRDAALANALRAASLAAITPTPKGAEMSHSMTAQGHALQPQPDRCAPAGQAFLTSAMQRLRTVARLHRATPEQIAARDAAAVRALADSCRDTDPGFASDLYAAVNRHECAFDAHAIGAR